MLLSLHTLTSIIRTGLLILVELIDLVKSVIIFLSQITLLRWLTFLLGSQTVILIVLLIDFPTNSQQDAPFHRIAYDYFRADWDGLRDHLGDVSWRISFNLVLLLLLVNFVGWFRLKLMYIFLKENIRSNFIHLHSVQLLALLL